MHPMKHLNAIIKKITTYCSLIVFILFASKTSAKNDTINDHSLKTNKLQHKGYSQNKDGELLAEEVKWYKDNNTLLNSRDLNYDNSSPKSKILQWPIIYLGYSIATKSQVTGGLELCLDCKEGNKFFIGLGYGVTSYDGEYYSLPDIHLSYNIQNSFFIKTGGSDKNAYALTGLSFLNMMDLGLGYSIPFNREKSPVIKGLTLGVTFRYSHNKNVYGKLKMF